MARRFFPALVSVIGLVVAAREAAAAEPQIQKGTVISASAGRLVMKDTGGKEQSFSVDAAAKVTVNGKPGKLEDLQETMPVQVTIDEKGKVLAVSTIDKDKRPVLVALAVPLVGPGRGNAERRLSFGTDEKKPCVD